MERILAILSTEADYARGLASYLSGSGDFIFKPMVFTEPSAYKKFEESNHVDVLLYTEEVEAEIGTELKAENVCMLVGCSVVGEAGLHTIFKYQSSKNIKHEIIELYGKSKKNFTEKLSVITPGKEDSDEAGKNICVCSPIGGSYCSTYALALAKYYSQKGKTLFMSFDPFFLFPGESKSRLDRNLSDILYYLQIDDRNLMGFMEGIVHKAGALDYISGVSHLFDISDISPANMRKLFKSLTEEGKYRTIIFDLGTIGTAGLELMANCEKVYLTAKRGRQYEKTILEWRRQLALSGDNFIIDKVCEREVPYDEMLAGDYSLERILDGAVGGFIAETEGENEGRYRFGSHKAITQACG